MHFKIQWPFLRLEALAKGYVGKLKGGLARFPRCEKLVGHFNFGRWIFSSTSLLPLGRESFFLMRKQEGVTWHFQGSFPVFQGTVCVIRGDRIGFQGVSINLNYNQGLSLFKVEVVIF